MKVVFDTDVLIDYFYTKHPGAGLVHAHLQEEPSISVITWGELTYGYKKARYQNKIDTIERFFQSYSVEVLYVTKATIDIYTDIRISLEKKGAPMANYDLLIAATTLEHDAHLITRNTKHFSRISQLDIISHIS